MQNFLVTISGTVKYTARILVGAANESEAESIALTSMPSISKNTCDDEEDINNVEISDATIESPTEDALNSLSVFHTINESATVGRETFFVITWNCQEDKHRVCVGYKPGGAYPDGYFVERGQFSDLTDARAMFHVLVKRARLALDKAKS